MGVRRAIGSRRRAFHATVVVLLAALIAVLSPVGVRADAPRFIASEPLSISESALRQPPRAGWAVDVVNPDPSRTMTVEVRVVGGLSDALSVAQPRTVDIPPGGTATFRLVPGRKPHSGRGELVVWAAGGLDRRTIVVEKSFWRRHRATIGTGALGLLLVAAAAFLLARRRRPASWWAAPFGSTVVSPALGGAGQSPATLLASDEPTEDDHLDRAQYAAGLAQLARDGQLPLVIGVFAEWGAGKTSLLMRIRRELREDRACAVAWFEPWKFQHEENPVLPLLHAVVRDLGLESAQDVRRTLMVISRTLGSIVLSTASRITVADLRASIDEYDTENFRLRSARTRLDEHFSFLVRRALEHRNKKRLVVFVDDLDRCLPDQIIALLEALKLYLNRPDCVFFLAVDSNRLQTVVAKRFSDSGDDGTDYLEKIVQIPFRMPRLSERAFAGFIDGQLTAETAPAAPVLKAGLRRNPRTVRRFINALVLQDILARARGVSPYHVATLAVVLLLRLNVTQFYAELEQKPTLLRQVADELESPPDGGPRWDETVLGLVRSLVQSGIDVPEDLTDYIDLASASTPGPVASTPGHMASTPGHMTSTGRRRVTANDVRAMIGTGPGGFLHLANADLSGEDLNGLPLQGADLRGSDLSNAVLSNADLSAADLRGANLSGATWPYRDAAQAVADGVLIDTATVLPEQYVGAGSVPPGSSARDYGRRPDYGDEVPVDRAALIELVRGPLLAMRSTSHPLIDVRWRLRTSSGEPTQPGVGDGATLDGLVIAGQDLIILGEAGSGKTVLARRLAVSLLDQAERDSEARIPLLLPLNLWNDSPDLAQWVADAAGSLYRLPPGAMRDLINRGGLILLLDGLDESRVPARCAEEIARFQHRYPTTRLVVTARPVQYADFGTLLRFGVAVELLPPSREEIERYLSQRLPNAEAARLLSDDMLRTIDSPLVMSVVAEALATGTEIAPLTDILDQQLDRSVQRIAEVIQHDSTVVRDILKTIARYLIAADTMTFAADDGRVRTILRTRGLRGAMVARFLQTAVDHGVLIEPGPGVFAFPHRLIVDRFAALPDANA
jgi:hypothetical protein